MLIDYERSLDDLVDFNIYHLEHSSSGPPSLWIVTVPILAAFVTASLALRQDSIPDVIGVIAFSTPWFYIPVMYLRPFRRWKLRKFYRQGSYARHTCRHRLSIAPDGLVESSDFGLWRERWTGVQRIVVTDRHIFIYTAPNFAYIIPKQAFADQSACEEFVDTARRYHAEAQA